MISIYLSGDDDVFALTFSSRHVGVENKLVLLDVLTGLTTAANAVKRRGINQMNSRVYVEAPWACVCA